MIAGPEDGRGSKVRRLPEALDVVQNGCHLGLGGFAITRCVMGAVHELIRLGRRGLTVVQPIGGVDTDLLVGAGCVDRLIYAGGSFDRFGPLHSVSHALAAQRLQTEEYSSLTMTLRLHAGALNLPHIATRSLLGSDLLPPLLETESAHLGNDPFGGGSVLLLAPLRPEVAIIHVDRADESGNAVLRGPNWTLRELAFASGAVVLLAEEVVPAGILDPDRVLIPSPYVTSVVEMPRAAHPTAAFGLYDYDRPHLEEYASLAKMGTDGIYRYLERYVLGAGDHAEYLRRVDAP